MTPERWEAWIGTLTPGAILAHVQTGERATFIGWREDAPDVDDWIRVDVSGIEVDTRVADFVAPPERCPACGCAPCGCDGGDSFDLPDGGSEGDEYPI